MSVIEKQISFKVMVTNSSEKCWFVCMIWYEKCWFVCMYDMRNVDLYVSLISVSVKKAKPQICD